MDTVRIVTNINLLVRGERARIRVRPIDTQGEQRVRVGLVPAAPPTASDGRGPFPPPGKVPARPSSPPPRRQPSLAASDSHLSPQEVTSRSDVVRHSGSLSSSAPCGSAVSAARPRHRMAAVLATMKTISLVLNMKVPSSLEMRFDAGNASGRNRFTNTNPTRELRSLAFRTKVAEFARIRGPTPGRRPAHNPQNSGEFCYAQLQSAPARTPDASLAF